MQCMPKCSLFPTTYTKHAVCSRSIFILRNWGPISRQSGLPLFSCRFALFFLETKSEDCSVPFGTVFLLHLAAFLLILEVFCPSLVLFNVLSCPPRLHGGPLLLFPRTSPLRSLSFFHTGDCLSATPKVHLKLIRESPLFRPHCLDQDKAESVCSFVYH